jgi:hypothetical protein
MAGTIRLITKKPDTNSPFVSADGSISETDHSGTNCSIRGVVDFPVLQQPAPARITAGRSEDSGCIYNIGKLGRNQCHFMSELWSSRITIRGVHIGYLQFSGRTRTVEVHLYADIA